MKNWGNGQLLIGKIGFCERSESNMKEVIVVGGTDTIFEYLGTIKLNITLVQYKEKITGYQISRATKIILIDEEMSY